MNLKALAQPAVEPVMLADLKEYLRVDTSTEDSTIAAMAAAAREHIERYTRRTMIYTPYRLIFDTFPAGTDIELPRSPAIDAAASTVAVIGYATPRIRYYDDDGQQQTMTVDVDYELLLDDNPPRIVVPALEVWPITYTGQRGAVEIDFISGYGSSGAAVPPMLKTAIRMIVAHWYEHREAVGQFGNEVPLAVDSILRLYQDGGYN
jgi:uncharacterized phiE125 gp8 family phage protein